MVFHGTSVDSRLNKSELLVDLFADVPQPARFLNGRNVVFHVFIGTRSLEQTNCALKSQLNTPWHWNIEATNYL